MCYNWSITASFSVQIEDLYANSTERRHTLVCLNSWSPRKGRRLLSAEQLVLLDPLLASWGRSKAATLSVRLPVIHTVYMSVCMYGMLQ